MHTIRLYNIKKEFKRREVVKGINIEIEQGEIVGLLGPNGAGKTTTFQIIIGEMSADSGNIFFDDIDITKFPMYKRAQLGIGYLPQEPSAFRGLTVEENIVAMLEMNRYSKEQIKKRVEEVMMEFDMTLRRKIKAKNLSGGEREGVWKLCVLWHSILFLCYSMNLLLGLIQLQFMSYNK